MQAFQDKLLETRSRAAGAQGARRAAGSFAQNAASPVTIDTKKREPTPLTVGVNINQKTRPSV
jgi:hypothetical protein